MAAANEKEKTDWRLLAVKRQKFQIHTHLIDFGDITRLCITCSEMPFILVFSKQKSLTLKCVGFTMELLWNKHEE